jgi:basic membrane lipoprotein Med (substrate-binding protein (PBP1-ABC) superfamily)
VTGNGHVVLTPGPLLVFSDDMGDDWDYDYAQEGQQLGTQQAVAVGTVLGRGPTPQRPTPPDATPDAALSLPLSFHRPPVFSSLTARNLSASGLTPMRLDVAPGPRIPVSYPLLLLACVRDRFVPEPINDNMPAVLLRPLSLLSDGQGVVAKGQTRPIDKPSAGRDEFGFPLPGALGVTIYGDPMFSLGTGVVFGFEYIVYHDGSADGLTLRWESQPVLDSRLLCPRVAVYLSYNDGITYHYSGFWAPVAPAVRIKAVSLYPLPVAESAWVTAHNLARIESTVRFQAAADLTAYEELSWRVPSHPTGRHVAPAHYEAAKQANATLIICAGNQYLDSAAVFAQENPGISILVMSSLRQILTPKLPNWAFATGRMYEAMFLAGYVAGSVTRSGAVGILVALDHPTNYGLVNAFFLGARRAVAEGLGMPGVSNFPAGEGGVNASLLYNLTRLPLSTMSLQPAPGGSEGGPTAERDMRRKEDVGRMARSGKHLALHVWEISTFSDEWAEKNAAIDLLDKKGVDVLLTVTDSTTPQIECHKRGCYSVGINGDSRPTLGDSVLISTLYDFSHIYLEFMRRVITGTPFASDIVLGGLGKGVEISAMAPAVPLRTQQRVTQIANELRRKLSGVEAVFCNDALVDASGVVRFNASDQASFAHVHATLDTICMDDESISRMHWPMYGVIDYGRYVPPTIPGPEAWVATPGVLAALIGAAAITLLLSIVCCFFIVIYRNYLPVRLSSPVFLGILTGGTALMAAWLLVLASASARGHITDSLCETTPWVGGIAFASAFGALCAKVWRVSVLLNNKKLKKVRVTTVMVARLMIIVMVAEITLLILLHFVFPRHARVRLFSAVDSQRYMAFSFCAAKDGNPGSIDGYVILNAAHLILLAWGAVLAFMTRHASAIFNESKWIALSIYNVIACEVLAVVIESFAESTPGMQLFAAATRMGAAPALTLSLLFFPKVHLTFTDSSDRESPSTATSESRSVEEPITGPCSCIRVLWGKRLPTMSATNSFHESPRVRRGGEHRVAPLPPQSNTPVSGPDDDYWSSNDSSRVRDPNGKYHVVTAFESGLNLEPVPEADETEDVDLEEAPKHHRQVHDTIAFDPTSA